MRDLGSGRTAGFSLLETLLALTLIGLGLLFAFAALLQHAQAAERLRAHEAAWRALDSRLEELRAGADVSQVIGQPDTVDGSPFDGPSDGPVPTIQILSEVTPASANGLLRVVVTARYTAGDRAYERRLESLLWRPQP